MINYPSRKELEERLGIDVVNRLAGEQSQSNADSDQSYNDKPISCPECATSILRPMTGILILVDDTVKAHEDKLEILYKSKLPNLNHSCHWLIDNMYKFENLGFTKAVPITKNKSEMDSASDKSKDEVPNLTANPEYRYLVCAECNRGPIGWQDPETKCCYLHVYESD